MPAEPFVSAGLFVVFEGGEGAGKSTQVAALAERAARRRAATSWSPASRARPTVGERIRSRWCWTRSGADGAVAPRAEALLYAADRAHHVATVVRPALARGAVVISDRYVDSSLAYQGAGRTLPVDEVSWLSSWATGGLKPDLVVLLDVDPRIGLARVAPRRRRRPAGGRVARLPRAGPVRVPRPRRRRPEALPGARRDPPGRGDRRGRWPGGSSAMLRPTRPASCTARPGARARTPRCSPS